MRGKSLTCGGSRVVICTTTHSMWFSKPHFVSAEGVSVTGRCNKGLSSLRGAWSCQSWHLRFIGESQENGNSVWPNNLWNRSSTPYNQNEEGLLFFTRCSEVSWIQNKSKTSLQDKTVGLEATVWLRFRYFVINICSRYKSLDAINKFLCISVFIYHESSIKKYNALNDLGHS